MGALGGTWCAVFIPEILKTRRPSGGRRGEFAMHRIAPAEPVGNAGPTVGADPVPTNITLKQPCVYPRPTAKARLWNGLGPSRRWDDGVFSCSHLPNSNIGGRLGAISPRKARWCLSLMY